MNVKIILFNDALNTIYLRLFGVGHTDTDYSDNERGNPLSSFMSSIARGLLYPPSHRQDNI